VTGAAGERQAFARPPRRPPCPTRHRPKRCFTDRTGLAERGFTGQSWLSAWLEGLREDNRTIIRAASAASKAADYRLAFRTGHVDTPIPPAPRLRRGRPNSPCPRLSPAAATVPLWSLPRLSPRHVAAWPVSLPDPRASTDGPAPRFPPISSCPSPPLPPPQDQRGETSQTAILTRKPLLHSPIAGANGGLSRLSPLLFFESLSTGFDQLSRCTRPNLG
jgi:hypothetical protein